MSDKDRKKKDGERKGKKNERMREDVKARHDQGAANAKNDGIHTDQGDMYSKPNAQMEEGQNRPR
jgi:hypothetical protein